MATLARDDVNAREAQLQALIQVLGFADLDELETFVYLHGSVKVVPVAQSDTLPLDETQTQASEAHRDKRRRDRLAENGQLKRELERTRADLEWHRGELAREQRRNDELERDKARLLDALADATAACEAEAAVAMSGSASPLALCVDPGGDHRIHNLDGNHSAPIAGPSAAVEGAPASMGAPVEGGTTTMPSAAEATTSATGAPQTAEQGAVSGSPPPPVAYHARLADVFTPDPPTRTARPSFREETDPERTADEHERPIAAVEPIGLAGPSEDAHPGAAHDIRLQIPPRPLSVVHLQANSFSASPQTTQSSNARAVALYPKLAKEFRKVRESTFDAQQRLAEMERQLAKASEQIRQFFERAVGAKPIPLDLATFPEPAAFPSPESHEARLGLAEDPSFLAQYSALRQQESTLARHLAQVETWLQRASLTLTELSRLPSASKRSSTPHAGIELVRKRRKVQGTPTTPASVVVRPDSRQEAQAASVERSAPEPIIRPSTSALNALNASPNLTSPATPVSKAEPRSSGSSRRVLANTTSQAAPGLHKRANSDLIQRDGRSPPVSAVGQDENVAPPSPSKASPRPFDVKHEASPSPSPRAGLPSSPRQRVPSWSSTTSRGRSVKVEPKLASSPPSSPQRTEAWSDLDALTPPAVDEETRKKLKKRNQLKRKRQREASGHKQETAATTGQEVNGPNSRKKADRQRMLAEACDSCTSYFQRAGKPVQCGHMYPTEGNHYLAMRARGIEERLQENGRHRVQQATDAPPPDYWQFGFPASQSQVDAFNARVRAARKSK